MIISILLIDQYCLLLWTKIIFHGCRGFLFCFKSSRFHQLTQLPVWGKGEVDQNLNDQEITFLDDKAMVLIKRYMIRPLKKGNEISLLNVFITMTVRHLLMLIFCKTVTNWFRGERQLAICRMISAENQPNLARWTHACHD